MKVDVRVIAATNRDLERAVARGDASARTSTTASTSSRIRAPAAARAARGHPAARRALPAQACAARGRGAASAHPEALAALAGLRLARQRPRAREHPGAARGRRAAAGRSTSATCRAGFRERPPSLEEPLFAGLPTLEEMEKRYLRHVLAAVGGNRSRAAEALGIDRRTLYRMAERFGLDLGRRRARLRPDPGDGVQQLLLQLRQLPAEAVVGGASISQSCFGSSASRITRSTSATLTNSSRVEWMAAADRQRGSRLPITSAVLNSGSFGTPLVR